MSEGRTGAMELTRDLNSEQVAAVTHGDGPQLVIAGAGSGKTRVITYRIAWLVEERGVDPARIVAVTFTNKAAAEMRERVEELLGLSPLPAFVGTFHRYCLVLLRRYGERVGLARDFIILDAGDQRSLIKQALADEGLSEKSYHPGKVLGAISSAKNRLLDHQSYAKEADTFFSRKVAQVFRRYQNLARQSSGIDFDDMIAYAVKILREENQIADRVRFRAQHLLVDEYQDTNHAQLELIRLLTGSDGNLTAVGDEDQGIYSWRGAELANILEFEKTFPGATIRMLERNYRSTQRILDASGAVVAHNESRRGKRLWTDAGDGAPIELYRAADEQDEARWVVSTLEGLDRGDEPIPPEEVGILVRTNAQTRSLEDELLRREVPYQLVGGTRFYERAEIKDLVAYLRVLRNPRDALSFDRILNKPPRGIGRTTQDRLAEAAAEISVPMWDVLYQDELGDFPARSAKALRAFRDLILDLRKKAEELSFPDLLEELLKATDYESLYDENDPEGLARLENIREFLSAAREFTESGLGAEAAADAGALTAFLDHAALMSDLDSLEGGRGVSVMTLHSAKGLEFQAVFVTGLEDGLLPHFNAQGTPEDIEEERRLFYVGMTRAKERLFLTSCKRRRIAGYYQDQMESPFLAEVPPELVQASESPSLFESGRTSGVYSFFGHQGGGGSRPSSPGRPSPGRPSPGQPTRSGPSPIAGLNRGMRVRHPSLGPGTVLDLDGTGDTAKVTVFFDRDGKRKLMAKFASLEPEE